MAKKIVKKITKKTIKYQPKKIVKKTTKKIIKSKPVKTTKKISKTKPIKSYSKKLVLKPIKKTQQKLSQAVKKTMTIAEITRAYPECALIMMNHGLYCVGCGVAMYETLEEGARAHGISDLEIDDMMKEMNSAIAKR